MLEDKLEYLADNDDHNTLAIGSSYIYRHFIPQQFDSLTGKKSFNLGTPGMGYMESAHLLDNILDKKEEYLPEVKDIMLLTQMSLLNIAKQNLHTDRVYWVDSRRFLLGVNVFRSNIPELWNYLVALYEKSFLFQLRTIFLKRLIHEKRENSFEFSKGFVCLDDEPSQKYRSTYFKRKYNYPKRGGYNFTYDPSKYDESCNYGEKCFLQDLHRLSLKAKSKGIRLHFVFLPNDVLHRKLQLDRTLYFGDGTEIEELFEMDNYFDKWHLNRKGAKIFTARLAELYTKEAFN